MVSDDRAISLSRPFRVLIVGGSYSGLSAALTLLDLCNGRLARFNYTADAKPPNNQIPIHITLVDERDGFSLASESFASKTWIQFADIPALQSSNIQLIRGSVNSVNPREKIAHILDLKSNHAREEQYDFLIAGSGLRRAFPTVPQSLLKEQFLAEAKAHQRNIQNAREGVVVVGGGAVGVEVAAELKILEPWQKVTLVHSRDQLLSAEPLPDDFKERVCAVLREVGVEIILGQRVIATTASTTEGDRQIWQLTLADQTRVKAGHVINAVSKSVPTTSYLPQEAMDTEGYVPIRSSLQFPEGIPNADHHFAVGDIATWAAIKRCGGAMHMGYYAANNVHQLILSESLNVKPDFLHLADAPPVIGLALGDNAVSYTSADRTQHGKHLLELMFGDDMGHSICWNYMRLSEPCKA
ncbi:hypothetical protein FE257_012280 [Aspergillus nanangensis]|uniref:FAD/NAD(P)-binding domain-containing protein n=1 Tax=Aspergillus nanangensis TaxID=2582783 RepID=A0AAD4CG89_ASPNN|nr:hypothetical protein FE257_012280 [Aspergillus nanangensis]